MAVTRFALVVAGVDGYPPCGVPPGVLWALLTRLDPGRDPLKFAEEIMEILAAFDLTGSYRDAGELAGCSHNTVARVVVARDAGLLTAEVARRAQIIDSYLDKIEEWVELSHGRTPR